MVGLDSPRAPCKELVPSVRFQGGWAPSQGSCLLEARSLCKWPVAPAVPSTRVAPLAALPQKHTSPFVAGPHSGESPFLPVLGLLPWPPLLSVEGQAG